MTKLGYHRKYLRILRSVAAQLGYGPDDCDIRSNKGGPAVPGEITLHSDTVYIQVCGDRIMYRSCRGRRDYVGGVNRWIRTDALTESDESLQRALRCFRDAAAASGKEPAYPSPDFIRDHFIMVKVPA